ncbi:MAG TPA: winged helix-turn-helix domain-containing protein [Stellaceae bacterium]
MRFLLADHLLDTDRRELHCGPTPVPVEPQVFDLLVYLIENRDRVVSKDDLIASVWGGRIVSDSTLTSRINAARRALGDNGDEQRLIRTVARKGIRFVGDVRAQPEGDAAAAPPEERRPPGAPPSDRPAIAVLPFLNMSGEPQQEYFSDGISEDIITALCRYPSLFVVARNSSFTFKGRPVDVKEIGRALGVRYVLEGSLRKAGERIRLTGQLVETETGNHIWAERYDRDLTDIFAVQDEIAEAVTLAVAPAIADAELHRAMRKPPANLDAWEAYQRGLWHSGKANAEDNALAEQFFRQAVELDPSFAGGYKGLARLQAQTADFRGRNLAEALKSAEALARRAVSLDGADAEARSRLANALYRQGDYEGGLAEAERALAISPNLADGHGEKGAVLIFSGRPKEGLASLERCIRLDPGRSALRQNQITLGLYLSREYQASVDAAKRAIRSYPDYPNTHRWLAAALGQLDRREEAAEALAKAIELAPVAFDMYIHTRPPWMRPEDHAHMLEGLHKAGFSGAARLDPAIC